RAEQQRNEAALNIEELVKAFQKYRQKITEKLEKVNTEEVVLGKRLTNYEKEKEKLNEKCVSYRKDLGIQEEQLRQLKEENHRKKEEIKILQAKNSEMVSMLTQSNEKIFQLESELSEREMALKEKNALISENTELKELTAQQLNHLKLCQQEIKDTREELNILETIISQLSQSTSEEFKGHHLKRQLSSASKKEALSESCSELNKPLIADLSNKLSMKELDVPKSHANFTVCTGVEYPFNDHGGRENNMLCGLETEPIKLVTSPAERIKYQQLESISKKFEKEKQRFQKEIKELSTKLKKADDEKNSLKTTMAQRASQFQVIQEDLLKKVSKTSSLEKEITKKSSQLSALQKQLEEKTIAYSTATARNSELEQELKEKNRCIHELEIAMSKEHEQIASAFEKEKLVYLEQHKKMEKQ
ncbi:CCD18 protein, partial [Upupa epops]|nr:CCD18 protein [Upupa epops]